MKNNTRKTIWGIIFSIFILIGSQIGSELIASVLVLFKVPEYVCNIVAGMLYIGICYKLLKLLCTKYLKSSLKNYYIPKFKVDKKWVVIGLLLPLLVSGVYIFLISGNYSLNSGDLTKNLNLLTAGIFFFGIAAGVVEELVFRGVIMNALNKRYNKKVAILVPSLLFGIVHILGSDFTASSSLLVVLAGTLVGIMFSFIAEEGKSVWNSAIVHALWNTIIIGGILNIGNSFSEESIYNYVLNSDSFYITGGDFGIESSVIAMAAYILVSLIAIVYIKKKKH